MSCSGGRLGGALALIVMGIIAAVAPASASAAFGIEAFENAIVNREGSPVVQAGSHPYEMITNIAFYHHEEEGETFPDGDPKDIEVNLPAGLVVNPRATETCSEAELKATECPNSAAVGEAELKLNFFPNARTPVFNITPQPGIPAELGMNLAGLGIVVHIVGGVRTGSDYGLTAKVSDIIQKQTALYGTKITLWGNPSDQSHDKERGLCGTNGDEEKVAEEQEAMEKEIAEKGKVEKEYFCPVERTERPLLTMPASCAGEPLATTISTDSWQEPGRFDASGGAELADPHWKTAGATSPAITGCEGLAFTPSLVVQPATQSEPPTPIAADSPSGLSVELKDSAGRKRECFRRGQTEERRRHAASWDGGIARGGRRSGRV